MITLANDVAYQAIEVAIREIVSAKHRPEGSYVSLPLLYPSGSTAVVRISGGPNKYFVTDFGMGFIECELMGIEKVYLRQAKTIGERSGVGFDEHAFFAMEVNADRLAGAIITIANCSVEAVTLTSLKSAEKSSVDSAIFMLEKLDRIFGAERVLKHTKILGASNHEWRFAATVSSSVSSTVFEFATNHSVSVANVSMKMNDVARLDVAPKRVVMVEKKKDMGTYLGILSHTASVIEQNIDDGEILKLAEAA